MVASIVGHGTGTKSNSKLIKSKIDRKKKSMLHAYKGRKNENPVKNSQLSHVFPNPQTSPFFMDELIEYRLELNIGIDSCKWKTGSKSLWLRLWLRLPLDWLNTQKSEQAFFFYVPKLRVEWKKNPNSKWKHILNGNTSGCYYWFRMCNFCVQIEYL